MIRLIFFIFVLIVIDQLTKSIFSTVVLNKGISFGINLPYNFIIFVYIVWFFVLVFLKFKKQIDNVSFVFLMSWLLWNLIDRIFLWWVRDFIDLKIWPVFNLADVYLTIGVLYLLYFNFLTSWWKK